jgi:hypothetical protein
MIGVPGPGNAHCLVAAKHQPELLFFMNALLSFHRRRYAEYSKADAGDESPEDRLAVPR